MSANASAKISYAVNGSIKTITNTFPVEYVENVKECMANATKPPVVNPVMVTLGPSKELVPFYYQPSNLFLFILFLVCIILYLLIEGSPFTSEQARTDA